MRRGEQHGATRRAILEGLEHTKQQALAGWGEKVNAIKIGKAGKGCGIRVGGEPLARIAALKAGFSKRRTGIEIACERLLAAAGFALDGSKLQVRRGYVSLQKQFVPGCTNANEFEWSVLRRRWNGD